MSENIEDLPISADLLAILRDPVAVQDPEKYGSDPGKLELVHNCWLVSADTGYKYPIKDGIPVMLIEEGARWQDTAIEDLPVPPETADPLPGETSDQAIYADSEEGGMNYAVLAGGLIFGLMMMVLVWRFFGRKKNESTPD